MSQDSWFYKRTVTTIVRRSVCPVQTIRTTNQCSRFLGQVITTPHEDSKLFCDTTSLLQDLRREDEILFDKVLADLPTRLPSGSISASSSTKHKQRGLNKLSIPAIDDLKELDLFLEDSWSSLLKKSFLLRSMADGQESATEGSYLKLYKTIMARRRQLAALTSIYWEFKNRHKVVEIEFKAMKDEFHHFRQWCKRTIARYRLTMSQSAFQKDIFIFSLSQPVFETLPEVYLLHRNGMVGESDSKLADNILDRLISQDSAENFLEEVYAKIEIWVSCELALLRQDLRRCIVAGKLLDCSRNPIQVPQHSLKDLSVPSEGSCS